MASLNTQLLDWAIATATLPGESESGDLYLVKPFQNGALVVVTDGLGHGPLAAAAARAAVASLGKQPEASVNSLVKRCHQDLLKTRGVVLSLAAFNALEGTMTWLGVGNVDGILLHTDSDGKTRREALLPRRGVVGGRLPPLNACILPIIPGDTLIFVTDGIRGGYEPKFNPRVGPKKTADKIVAEHRLGTDDALVLVARYTGNQRRPSQWRRLSRAQESLIRPPREMHPSL